MKNRFTEETAIRILKKNYFTIKPEHKIIDGADGADGEGTKSTGAAIDFLCDKHEYYYIS
jgi:hypothetical protein